MKEEALVATGKNKADLSSGGSEVKVSASNAGDLGSIPWSGRFPGKGTSNLLQYSCLENPRTVKTVRLQPMGSQRVGHDRMTSLHFKLNIQRR